MNNESCISDMMFCRKCKILKWDVYDTKGFSEYKFICKGCAYKDGMIGTCNQCGREGLESELKKFGGYCHKCEKSNIVECKLCGSEIYISNSIDGICKKCSSGKNKQCLKCGIYMSYKKISGEGLCEKCTISIYKVLKDSKVNEIVECIDCGREVYINDLNEGLCIYCYSGKLEYKIKKLEKRKKVNYI